MDTSNPIILTACTNRKRIVPPAELRAASLPAGSLSAVASCWLTRLRRASPSIRAGDLYAGRGFGEARAAAGSADLYIASAGLGIVHADATVPTYSLTVAPGASDDVLSLVDEAASVADWWRAGPANSPFHAGLDDIVRRCDSQLVLAALPSAYLKMLAGDLERFLDQIGDHLRLFCAAPPAGLPSRLVETIMPYDARFDGPDSPLPGTRSDFAQRAMRHFARTVLPRSGPTATSKAHWAAVERAMTGLKLRVSVDRGKATDAEIIALVVQNWGAAGGRSGQMLRLLRDGLGVACEQRRFARLFQAAAECRCAGAPA